MYLLLCCSIALTMKSLKLANQNLRITMQHTDTHIPVLIGFYFLVSNFMLMLLFIFQPVVKVFHAILTATVKSTFHKLNVHGGEYWLSLYTVCTRSFAFEILVHHDDVTRAFDL